MAHIVEKNKKRFRGPHLLDRDQLLVLGSLLEREWDELEAKRESDINALVETRMEEARAQGRTTYTRDQALRHLPYELSKASREVVLELASGAECRSETIRGAVNELYDSVHSPTSLKATVISGEHSIKVELSSGILGERQVSVEPPKSPTSKNAFVELCNWFEEIRPPFVARLYRFLSPIAWMIVMSLALTYIWVKATGSEPAISKEAAEQILEDGLSQSEVPAALELLLRKSFDIGPPTAAQAAPVDSTVVLVAYLIAGSLLLIMITSSIVPDLLIGIGVAGQRKLRFSRWWLKYVCIGAPALVCSVLLLPLITNFVLSLLAQSN
jgi:hypothetical protein